MLLYDISEDQFVPITKHTIFVVVAGISDCFDMLTWRKSGRKDWSLLYCEKGVVNIDNAKLYPGQVWIYPANSPQKYIPIPNSLYHYLHFTGSDLNELMKQLQIPLLTPIEVNKLGFVDMLKSVEKASCYNDFKSQLTCEYYVLRILHTLSNVDYHIDKNAKLGQIIEDMHHSYNKPYDASYYAKMLSISVDRFNHLFKSFVGSPPQKYYANVRMQNARFLLELTDLSITEIAKQVGFEDMTYFSQAFKKHIGTSPRQYRQAHK